MMLWKILLLLGYVTRSSVAFTHPRGTSQLIRHSTSTTTRPITRHNLVGLSTVPEPLLDIWTNYNVVLEAHPLYTKCVTSFVGFTLGDIIAQTFVENNDNEESFSSYDPIRTARLASFGITIHGTSGHYFYGFLDSALPGNAGATVAEKVLIDQVFWAPVFTFIFFGYNFLLEGKSLSEFISKCKADLFAGVRGSWSFWGPAHAINFALIPPSQRLLYINVLQVIYNIFLSFLGNKDVAIEEGGFTTNTVDEEETVQERNE